MKFCVNYINDEVLNLSTPDETYIKYKVVLHGVIPSSGSILDPKLCDGFEEFSKYIKSTNQQWLSFHLDYKDKYNNENYFQTIEKNINIIRSKFPDIKILIENLPPVDNIKAWCSKPNVFNEFLNKYNLYMLLDVPHAMISAEYFGLSFEEYINQFDLSKVVEIHFSGLGNTKDGKLYDGHIMAEDKDYACLEYAIKKCPNLKMMSLEFAPTRDYDGETTAKDYKSKRTDADLYKEQQIMLKKIKELYLLCENKNEK